MAVGKGKACGVVVVGGWERRARHNGAVVVVVGHRLGEGVVVCATGILK